MENTSEVSTPVKGRGRPKRAPKPPNDGVRDVRIALGEKERGDRYTQTEFGALLNNTTEKAISLMERERRLPGTRGLRDKLKELALRADVEVAGL